MEKKWVNTGLKRDGEKEISVIETDRRLKRRGVRAKEQFVKHKREHEEIRKSTCGRRTNL